MKNHLREKLYEKIPAFIVFVILFFCLASICLSAERPTVNVPDEWRKSNWLSPNGSGSCVHASFVSLLRWQGRYETAKMWEKKYSGGEWPSSFKTKLDKEGIRYSFTVGEGDVKFLEWACKTRRGAGVTVRGRPTKNYPLGIPGGHMVTLVHLDAKWAAILDNRATKNFIWIQRDIFIAEWKASHSWAMTPVYKPSAPAPEFSK